MKWSKKRIIGIILILSTLTALAFWELWGRSHLGYQKIPVLKRMQSGIRRLRRIC